VPVEVQLDIEQFLAYEARLLEENRLDEWLDLLAEDCTYVMPVRESVTGEAETGGGFALFDDDKSSLRLRAGRILSGVAPTEMPSALDLRLITNIVVEPRQENVYAVSSKFYVHQERRGRHTSHFVGLRDDVLRRTAESWEIAARTIHLAQTLLPSTITIFF
jgi:3-phenylpropionate/cinnamic acid dioxygenase small subunit